MVSRFSRLDESRFSVGHSSFVNFSMLNSTDPGPAVMLHEPSDYVQMVVFVAFMVIGLPVNLSTLFYMVKRYRHAKSFLLLLHINLNISDILVLGIYLPGLIGWLITLEWKGGAVLCKIMRFTDAFVFSIRHVVFIFLSFFALNFEIAT
ncbi:hypothetical protein Q1695_001955 [Nippostrongylus brasiliensis]|nr:hypothetical protein Q1695_001955 [Nippostrongylus brasiliensis]